MSARKLQQEIERCFKQVDIGVEAFDSQYEKYEQSTNASQRDKLVDNIKKECKKLQRLRDQIKTWAAGSDVKDKGPLQDKRELIETKMEAFKAVEKEMKTKAFSKEGLLANARLDPKEREKEEMISFLQDMVERLGEQIESQEASAEQLQAQAKKSKKGDTGKSERVAELEHKTERHKWHQGKLELLRRRLENDDIDGDAVKGAEEDIRNYVENNSEVDFYEDDGIYDEFNLEEETETYGALGDKERTGSQDTGVAADDSQETTPTTETAKSKPKPPDATTGGRRPSQHIRSPLPALATLHTLPTVPPATAPTTMKPAPLPPKPPGETLKYASAAAAAAAAATETTSIGIAPLPAPPGRAATSAVAPVTSPAILLTPTVSSSAAASPAVATVEAVTTGPLPDRNIPGVGGRAPSIAATRSPTTSHSSISGASPAVIATQLAQVAKKDEVPPTPEQNGAPISQEETSRDNDSGFESEAASPGRYRAKSVQANGISHQEDELDEDESIYHLPASLRELLGAYDSVKANAMPVSNPLHQRMLSSSYANRPDTVDAEKPRHYRPANPALYTPQHYPQEPLPIFDDPRLYSKIDTDALFYSFYYRQGTYQQFLAAKSLKSQSWRFHKQYQTWFQRHEEPQSITEDYEKGTYRFFDYESTWMNRRKANFNFEYKFLEDDL